MSNEMDMLEAIDHYLHGSMSETDKFEFEKKLKEDAVLRTLFEKQSAIHLLVMEAGLNDIRNLMRNDLSKASEKKKNSSTKWLGGGLLLVLGISVVGYLNKNREEVSSNVEFDKQKNSKLFIETKKPDQVLKNVNTIEQKSKEATLKEKEAFSDNKQIIQEQVINKSFTEVNTIQKEVISTVADQGTKQKSVILVQQDLCGSFDPKISFETKSSLVDASTGEIKCFSKEPNLKYKLNNVDMGQDVVFTNLVAGKYKVVAENTQGCKWESDDVIVKVTFCVENKKNTFNTVIETEYEMPVAENQHVDLIVYNKQMLNIASFSNVGGMRWDGRSNEGAIVETGLTK